MYHCMVFTMKFLASLNPSARQVATSLPGRCSLRHRLGTDGATQLCGAGAVRDTARKGVAKQPTMGKWGPWWAMYIYIYVGQFIPLVPGALGATLKIVIYIINKSAQAVSPTALVIGKCDSNQRTRIKFPRRNLRNTLRNQKPHQTFFWAETETHKLTLLGEIRFGQQRFDQQTSRNSVHISYIDDQYMLVLSS
jgi:hypothetical protein